LPFDASKEYPVSKAEVIKYYFFQPLSIKYYGYTPVMFLMMKFSIKDFSAEYIFLYLFWRRWNEMALAI
jgi:hypothetical protein